MKKFDFGRFEDVPAEWLDALGKVYDCRKCIHSVKCRKDLMICTEKKINVIDRDSKRPCSHFDDGHCHINGKVI